MRKVLFIALLTSCQLLEKPRVVTVVMDGDKAVGIDIPGQLLRGNDRSKVRVELAREGARTAVLGEFVEAGDDVRFLSLVPLTLGFEYDVFSDTVKIGTVQVPESEEPAPALLAVYPRRDTVPENQLKFYFQFSQSMREGRSASNIHLTNSKGDTMRGTFLDLQPELWNEDATVLTLWFDPGRIKLDLIPNQEYGNPLKKGETYTLHVSSTMESRKSKYLRDGFEKSFFVTDRDDHSPKPDKWRVVPPNPDKACCLEVYFEESLDHQLVMGSIDILDGSGVEVPGILETAYDDSSIRYESNKPWTPGEYTIRIESRLEDLAGNNLNRLFERDLHKEKKEPESKASYSRKFKVK